MADTSAFRLYEHGKIRHDLDFVFYGQKSSDDGTVRIVTEGLKTDFTVDLNRLKSDVQRIVFAATVDTGTIADLGAISISVSQGNNPAMVYGNVPMQGRSELALILGEIYRLNGTWKFRFVSQGFRGGLARLAEHFGVEIADEGSEGSVGSGLSNQENPQTVVLGTLGIVVNSKARELARI